MPLSALPYLNLPYRPRNFVAAPTGTADDLAAYNRQSAGLQRQWNQLPLDTAFEQNSLRNARSQFLNRLGETFTNQQQNQGLDMNARGLASSGIYNENRAKLVRNQLQQRGDYESQFAEQMNRLAQGLFNQRSALTDQQAMLRDQYEQTLAQRAAQLRLAGYGG